MPMLIEYMKCYRVGFGRAVGTLVCIGARLNLTVSLLGVRCTMTPLQFHIRLQCTMSMACGSALIMIWVEYIERYRVGFERTGRTLVLAHVRICMCHCWYTSMYNTIAIAHLPAIQLQWQ